MGKMKKKKNFALLVIGVVVVIMLVVLIVNGVNKRKEEEQKQRTLALYEKLNESESYTISLETDENNKKLIAREGEMARIDVYEDGEQITNLVKDGNTYVLVYNNDRYFTYSNNTTRLRKFVKELEEIVTVSDGEELQFNKGKEEINGVTYKYEEFSGTYSFMVKGRRTDIDEDNIVARFYYDGDELKYIKTISGEYEELVKVNIQYNTNGIDFDIPSTFEEGS
jgi:competence protein ComGC